MDHRIHFSKFTRGGRSHYWALNTKLEQLIFDAHLKRWDRLLKSYKWNPSPSLLPEMKTKADCQGRLCVSPAAVAKARLVLPVLDLAGIAQRCCPPQGG